MPPPAEVTSASIGDAVVAMVDAIKAQGGKAAAATAQLAAKNAQDTADLAQTKAAVVTAKTALDAELATIRSSILSAAQVTTAADEALKVQLDIITNSLNAP
jgi:hypothetical protein